MEEKTYFATLEQRITLGWCVVFFAATTMLGIWLSRLGYMPSAFWQVFGLITCITAVRLYRVNRLLVITVSGKIVMVFGWIWGSSSFDFDHVANIAVTSDVIILKQGSTGAGIHRNVVGSEAFDSLAKLFGQYTEDTEPRYK